MNEKLKQMPMSVKLSIAFLTVLYVLLWVFEPALGAILTVTGAIIYAIQHITNYFLFDK
jgi:hypothetical protein